MRPTIRSGTDLSNMSTPDETAEMLIRSARAADRRKRRAWLSRLIWYPLILVVLLVILAMSTSRGFHHDRRFMKTIQDVSQIGTAVDAYVSERDHFPMPEGIAPRPGGSSLLTIQPDGLEFLNLLQAGDPRGIGYLKLKKSPGRKQGGAFHDQNGRITALYDGWGNPYHIVLDTQGDGVLVAHRGMLKDKVQGKKFIMFSAGRDHELGTEDDFLSWNPRQVPPSKWQIFRSLMP